MARVKEYAKVVEMSMISKRALARVQKENELKRSNLLLRLVSGSLVDWTKENRSKRILRSDRGRIRRIQRSTKSRFVIIAVRIIGVSVEWALTSVLSAEDLDTWPRIVIMQ